MLKRKELDRILTTMLLSHEGTSDLNFTPGKPLQVVSQGSLARVEVQPFMGVLTPFQTEMLAITVMGHKNRGSLEAMVRSGSVDCVYELSDKCRFRVNVFRQRGQYSLVLHKLESTIKSLDDLGLPEVFREMAGEEQGLILVTGTTGSGRSTTLAALLNEINETRSIHILTIEDPIEYVHPHKKATLNQRELGTDFDSFHSCLRAALHQDPKVILIDEIRDRETMEICLTAASTGHLVLTTLHAIDCDQTISRVVDLLDEEEEPRTRARLAECLRFVVNQRLLPALNGGRLPSQEIMGMNLPVKELLVTGKTENKTFYDITSDYQNQGWQTHDQCIADLLKAGRISEDTAIANASDKSILKGAGGGLVQGERTEDELELTLDTTVSEANKLIKDAWPPPGYHFPTPDLFRFENHARRL